MTAHQTTAETGAAIVTKAAPPISVSVATVAGVHVSDILVWATLIYTVIMIGHKLWQIWKEIRT